MAQSPIRLISTNDYTTSVAVLIGTKRVEFFITPGMYHQTVKQLRQWIHDGWWNHATSHLIQRSDYAEFEGKKIPADQVHLNDRKVKAMSNRIPQAVDSTSTPDEEHQFTLIAPEAQNGLVYHANRCWHKSAEAAVEYSKLIYNANKDQTFKLVVVQAIEEVQPKPQVELISRSFTKSTS